MGKVIIMKCGHAANGVDKDGKPYCVICAGLTPNAYIVDDNVPDLTGRKARCSQCGCIVPSNANLFLFEYRPNWDYDKFYCGCGGWD